MLQLPERCCALVQHVSWLDDPVHCLQTGSWFEFANKNAVFGVLRPENPLWAISLVFFGVTGYPTAGVKCLRT